MSILAPCPLCARHVRVGESLCPFCGAATASLVAPPIRRVPRRLTRAALVAGALLGTACASSSSTEPEEPAAVEEPAQTEPAQEEPAQEEPPPEEDPGSQVEMYGAPSSDVWV